MAVKGRKIGHKEADVTIQVSRNYDELLASYWQTLAPCFKCKKETGRRIYKLINKQGNMICPRCFDQQHWENRDKGIPDAK